MNTKLQCTIGIMAYNEAANIGRLLEGLITQETNTVEISRIIVVASGCTDDTEAIVREKISQDQRIRLLIQSKREGKASAVNLFMEHARSAEIIVLASADLLPVPRAIEALVFPFIDPAVGMVGGHPVPTNPRDTFMGFGVNLLWDLHHQVSKIRPKMGELISFRNIFRQIPNDTAVDEASIEPLIIGQGMKLRYAPEAIVRHFHCGTSKEWSPWFLFLIDRNRLAMVVKNGSLHQVLWTLMKYLARTTINMLNMVQATMFRRPNRNETSRWPRHHFRVLKSLFGRMPSLIKKRISIQKNRKVNPSTLKPWFLERGR